MEQAYRTAADILSLIADDQTDVGEPISDERRQLYRQAAAVLVSLRRPDLLQPVGGGGHEGEGKEALKDELIAATGRNFVGTVMLHPDWRSKAIAELNTIDKVQNALMANPNERTGTLQLQLERYLLNVPIPIDEQSPEQLDETLQIVTWLQGTLYNLPSVQEVQARLAFRSFSAPLESLAGDNVFRGRRKELDQLRSYVGVLAPDALLSRIKGAVHQWVRPNALPALSISGPGGVGKSALVARFMLEHTRVDPEIRIPMAYLDFDRSVLSVSEPETLLVEIFDQLDLQFSDGIKFRELRDSFVNAIGAEPREKEPFEGNYAKVTDFITQLMKLLEENLGPRPFVIVLDTFEEVQFRGEALAFPFWEILDRMQQSFPFLRVVVSGRAPVRSLRLAGKEPEQLVLGDLDNEAAIAYLEGLGITNRELAQMLIKQLGSVPLSLKLGASVVKRDGIESIKDVSRRPSFFSSTSDSAIQGVLFARILGHLHDPALEKLAHPGLVLRRLSPAVILNVLNEPCELHLSNESEAKELFDRLARETSLVATDTLDGTLVHRPELRRTMLKLLIEKEPDKAAQINRKAVEWYKNQSGWRAKAEELYHRLQLRQEPSEREFSHPEVRSSLQGSISELPPVSQRYLAPLGFQIDPEILAQATTQEREAALAAEIEDLIPHGTRSVEMAEGLLIRITADHATPLFASAARVAMQLGRTKQAADLIEKGIEQATLDFNSELVLNLLAEKSWLKRREIAEGKDPETLNMFGELARQNKHQTATLQHRIQSYSLLNQTDPTTADLRSVLSEIYSLLSQISSYDLWSLFLLLENIAESLDHETQIILMRLVSDEEGPFHRVQFSSKEQQNALNDLIKISSELIIESFPRVVRELCRRWPYQILRVKPPYSSRSYGHDAALY